MELVGYTSRIESAKTKGWSPRQSPNRGINKRVNSNTGTRHSSFTNATKVRTKDKKESPKAENPRRKSRGSTGHSPKSKRESPLT